VVYVIALVNHDTCIADTGTDADADGTDADADAQIQTQAQTQMQTRALRKGHDAYCKLMAEGKPEEAALLPYFRDTLQYEKYGWHGKEGHDAYCKLVAEGKPGETALLPYFRDTLQHKRTAGQGGKNWLDYQSSIQKGGAIKDLQDHTFIIETTAGEDVE